MLKTLATLLLVAYCVGGSATEWASRIVTTQEGKVELTFYGTAAGTIPTFGLYPMYGNAFPVIFENGKCRRSFAANVAPEWTAGTCSYTAPSEGTPGIATITVYQVSLWRKLTYAATYPGVNGTVPLLVYFAHGGKYENRGGGSVIVKESAPLTRFVKGRKTVELKFGYWQFINPAYSTKVTLSKNGNPICRWKGQAFDTTDPNLNKEKNCGHGYLPIGADYAITFTNVYHVPLRADFYEWKTETPYSSSVTVVVDATQSGSAVTCYMLQVIFGLLATLLYLRQ